MKKKITGFCLALLLGSCLPLSLFGQESEPQYGGTLVQIHYRSNRETFGWSPIDGNAATPVFAAPFSEFLLQGDVINRGPRGNKEHMFDVPEFLPDDMLTGTLAESWKLTDPLTLTFQLRRGVMWTGNTKIGMAAREFVAQDAAFCLNKYKEGRMGRTWIPYIDSFEATGKYTLVAHFKKYSPTWAHDFGYGMFGGIYPPEAFNAGLNDWKNQVGTGPFILTDFVPASSATYSRNPNWWNRNQIINGKKHQIPFLDKLIWPIIVDTTTQIAALRTGKCDMHMLVPLTDKESLAKTNPNLMIRKYLKANTYIVNFDWWTQPFNNESVRRAMMIGTDMNAIVKAAYREGEVQTYPYCPSLPTTIWTPIKDLPAETRELFEYNPKKAKEMILKAYPNGFTTTLNIQSPAVCSSIASMLLNMWEQIGVKASIVKHDDSALVTLYQTNKFTGLAMISNGTGLPVPRLAQNADSKWYPLSADSYYTSQVDKLLATTDITRLNALIKELGVYTMNKVYEIPTGAPYLMVMWWPWVKNYYGEYECGWHNHIPWLSHVWIDQKMKKSLGY